MISENYNLLEEKWIPVLWKSGKTDQVGIIEAFTNAHEIRQIAASNPMDRFAIIRFLLALLYWCQGNPPNELPDDSFPKDWFKNLNDNRDCFNLLGNGKRFYQYKNESDKEKEEKTVNYLIHEVPTGTNLWHFRHSIDKVDGLCPACCTMGLLRLPVFATSAGKGLSPGINSKPPIYVIPLGSSLAETLRLLWKSVDNLGTPAWEEPDLELRQEGDVPLLTGLTWLPRRVWLDDPEPSEANCISCGHRERLIKQCVFAGKGSIKVKREWKDPHVILISGKEGDVIKPGNALDRPDASAGQWSEILAGILQYNKDKKANCGGKLLVVGFATVKNDKYLEAVEHENSLPNTLDEQKITESTEKIKVWQKETSNIIGKLKKVKARKSFTNLEIKSVINTIFPHIEAKVSAKIGELAAGGDDVWKQAADEYSSMMGAIAKSLSPGFTSVAVQRQKYIENIKPNIQTQQKIDEKTDRNK